MENKISNTNETEALSKALVNGSSNVRLPEHFEDFGETVMSNFDHCIDEKVATEIKGKDLSAQYSGWNFCGYCWWDKQSSKWCCEVLTYGSWQTTIVADELKDIMNYVSERWGAD